MDGRFVPNISVGPLIVEAVRRNTRLPIEAHLMIVEPERYVADFAAAGADPIIVHQEASPQPHPTSGPIKRPCNPAAAAINPATPRGAVREPLAGGDLVLAAPVERGFGGQAFARAAARKGGGARGMVAAGGLRGGGQGDGGFHAEPAPAAVRAPAVSAWIPPSTSTSH